MSTPTLPSPGQILCNNTEAPTTVRCETESPRAERGSRHARVDRHEERSALASMKCNIGFLQAILGGSASALALDALADLETAVSRLETSARPAHTLLPPRGHR